MLRYLWLVMVSMLFVTAQSYDVDEELPKSIKEILSYDSDPSAERDTASVSDDSSFEDEGKFSWNNGGRPIVDGSDRSSEEYWPKHFLDDENDQDEAQEYIDQEEKIWSKDVPIAEDFDPMLKETYESYMEEAQHMMFGDDDVEEFPEESEELFDDDFAEGEDDEFEVIELGDEVSPEEFLMSDDTDNLLTSMLLAESAADIAFLLEEDEDPSYDEDEQSDISTEAPEVDEETTTMATSTTVEPTRNIAVEENKEPREKEESSSDFKKEVEGESSIEEEEDEEEKEESSIVEEEGEEEKEESSSKEEENEEETEESSSEEEEDSSSEEDESSSEVEEGEPSEETDESNEDEEEENGESGEEYYVLNDEYLLDEYMAEQYLMDENFAEEYAIDAEEDPITMGEVVSLSDYHRSKREADELGEGAMCKTCVSFAGQALNQLLNIILQGGIVGGCAELCGKLPGPSLVHITCNVLCDVVGVKEFMNIVKKADLDPIYYCELLTACPVNDHGDASFTALSVDPASGPQGEFRLLMEFSSTNGTSTGQLFVKISTVDKIPAAGVFLMMKYPPGVYKADMKINAKPDPSCDPSVQPCEKWLPGTYTVQTALCAGKCGSKHPHSKVYDVATTKFTITPN